MNPERGGDTGWVATQAINASVAGIVAKLQPGQVSEIVRQGSACSVLQLVERRSFVKKPWEQAREDIRSGLLEQKMGEEYERFLQKMRAQTYIEKKGGYAVAAHGASCFGLPPVGARSEPSEGGGRNAFGE